MKVQVMGSELIVLLERVIKFRQRDLARMLEHHSAVLATAAGVKPLRPRGDDAMANPYGPPVSAAQVQGALDGAEERLAVLHWFVGILASQDAYDLDRQDLQALGVFTPDVGYLGAGGLV